MHRDNVERVVEPELGLQRKRQVANDAGKSTDEEPGDTTDESGARSDRYEAGDGTRCGAKRRRMPTLDLLDEQPRTHRGGGGEVGVDERLGGETVGPECRAGVETEPTEPQDARAEHRERQGVGRHRLLAPALALPDDEDDDKRRDACVDVHDGAAGEVECTPLEQPAVRAEHPVGDRCVHKQQPRPDEEA